MTRMGHRGRGGADAAHGTYVSGSGLPQAGSAQGDELVVNVPDS